MDILDLKQKFFSDGDSFDGLPGLPGTISYVVHLTNPSNPMLPMAECSENTFSSGIIHFIHVEITYTFE